MEGIYVSPISRWLEIGLTISGVLIVLFVFRAFMSGYAWGEGAEYDMLGLPDPHENPDVDDTHPMREGEGRSPDESAHSTQLTPSTGLTDGSIGLEDRIVRFGFSIALIYLAITWFGWRSPAMWILTGPILYFFATASWGRDPIYKWLKVSSK